MIKFDTPERLISLMVLFAVCLHLTWAILIWVDPTAVNATALNAAYRPIARFVSSDFHVLSGILVTVALTATYGMFTRIPWVVVLLLPQQLVLMMSASGAIEAIWLGQFADGVARARAFLAADQCYSILAAIGHTTAIIAHARHLLSPKSLRLGPR